MTTGIALFVLISVAVLLVLAELVREVVADQTTHTPRSHLEDARFRSPGAWS